MGLEYRISEGQASKKAKAILFREEATEKEHDFSLFKNSKLAIKKVLKSLLGILNLLGSLS